MLTEKWGGEVASSRTLSSLKNGAVSAGKIKTLTYLIENHSK